MKLRQLLLSWGLLCYLPAVVFLVAKLTGAATPPEPVYLSKYAPTRDYVERGNFLLSYDGRTRCARWVLERLSADLLDSRKTTREGESFYIDRELPAECRATPADYARSEYDRGHLAAAGNHSRSAESLRATFTIANAAPQARGLNRGPWRELEEYLRQVAPNVKCVWVVTMPLWRPSGHAHNTITSGWLTVRTLGASDVWIPTHFGKAALVEQLDGRLSAYAWILPNDDAAPNFDTCLVSVDELESAAGLDLWASLPDDVETSLERAQ